MEIIILVIIGYIVFLAFSGGMSERHKTQRYHSQISGKIGRSVGRSITGRGPRRWRL